MYRSINGFFIFISEPSSSFYILVDSLALILPLLAVFKYAIRSFKFVGGPRAVDYILVQRPVSFWMAKEIKYIPKGRSTLIQYTRHPSRPLFSPCRVLFRRRRRLVSRGLGSRLTMPDHPTRRVERLSLRIGLGCGRDCGEGGRMVRDDLVNTGDVEGGIVADKTRGVVVVGVVGIETGAGPAGASEGVGPGERAELSELEPPATSDDARFWLLESLLKETGEKQKSKSKEGAESLRIVPGRTFGPFKVHSVFCPWCLNS